MSPGLEVGRTYEKFAVAELLKIGGVEVIGRIGVEKISFGIKTVRFEVGIARVDHRFVRVEVGKVGEIVSLDGTPE